MSKGIGLPRKYVIMKDNAEKQSLVSLVQESFELTKYIIESDGELTQEIEARLDFNQLSLQEKIDACAFVSRKLKNDEQFFKDRAKSNSRIAQGLARAQDRIKERVKFSMSQLHTREMKGNESRYVLSDYGQKVIIEDENLIPEDFKIQVVQTAIDKEKLKLALTEGFSVPGARLEKDERLRVYDNADR